MTNDKQRERLVELLQEADKKVQEYILENDHMDWIPKLNELSEVRADYLLANGVIVPPCKVGDVVWLIGNMRLYTKEVICSRKVTSVQMLRTGELIMHFKDGCFPSDAVGVYVFLTKEEAEQALVTDKNVGSKMEEGAE